MERWRPVEATVAAAAVEAIVRMKARLWWPFVAAVTAAISICVRMSVQVSLLLWQLLLSLGLLLLCRLFERLPAPSRTWGSGLWLGGGCSSSRRTGRSL